MDGPVHELLDKQAIREVVLRYCRGIDRLDLDLVRSAYHPDGIDHHTGFDGTVDEFVAWVGPALRRFDGTMHLVGNHLAEVVGDRAVAETYGTAVHWGPPADDPRRNFTSGFRYVDHLERRAGTWGIVERFAVREWTHDDSAVRREREAPGPSCSRDGDDVVQTLLARLRAGELDSR
ncbi:nuclear transport factor 2 family protein [Nocardioides sp. YIM 152315]|uniref:nuclear transport factor 2 family protein n=1 Tax=Nocardioides sp. YIM 152315 TaxID=3031760 RepID=UPI0023DAA954|nr:nuclear transport factor 2 family protein [Nocardioides sp. YIM 152315]MDF1604721.1 nuclear transport factor 2 family protein [Nocardioides sp. YIM 152315]